HITRARGEHPDEQINESGYHTATCADTTLAMPFGVGCSILKFFLIDMAVFSISFYTLPQAKLCLLFVDILIRALVPVKTRFLGR
ncbi:hypothetical protein HAX54_023547, partial [Datura stramonium]|nr:hypothetical protein [Datura stramonium]